MLWDNITNCRDIDTTCYGGHTNYFKRNNTRLRKIQENIN